MRCRYAKRKSGSASRRGSKGIKHGHFCIHPAHELGMTVIAAVLAAIMTVFIH